MTLDVFIRSQRMQWFSLARAGQMRACTRPPPTGHKCVSGQQLSGATSVIADRGQ